MKPTSTNILIIAILFTACGDAKGGPGETGTSTTEETATTATTTSQEPCPSDVGAADDGTTGVAYDDAATFIFQTGDQLCAFGERHYVAAAWPVCEQNTAQCVKSGRFLGQSFDCAGGEAYPAEVSVTVHEPGLYTLGLIETEDQPWNEGKLQVLVHHCYGDYDITPYEVTEDDYNDVTTFVIEQPPQPYGEESCHVYCEQLELCE